MAFQSNAGKTSGVCRHCETMKDIEGGCQCPMMVTAEDLMQQTPEGPLTQSDVNHISVKRQKAKNASRPLDPESGVIGAPMRLGTGIVRDDARSNRQERSLPGSAAPSRKSQKKAGRKQYRNG